MAQTVVEGTDMPLRADFGGTSWSAIVGGAVAATAVSLILTLLGSGLGLTIVSPWTYAGVTATTFAVSAACWLILTQWISAGIGGYLSGRLRARWSNIDADEVLFRDTAHGFIAWALSTLFIAFILAAGIGAVTKAGTETAATVAAGGAVAVGEQAPPTGMIMDATRKDETGYLLDRLFRLPSSTGVAAPVTGPSNINPSQSMTDAQKEAQHILANMRDEQISDEDQTYLAQLIASRTGVTLSEAQSRVGAVMNEMATAKREVQEAADTARKAAAMTAIMGALSLVIGAFIAAGAGALGGHRRDDPSR